jgi:hypothetical protein
MYIETAFIGVICAVLGAAVTLLTYKRNGDKQVKDEAKENGMLGLDVAYIKKGVDDIRLDIKEDKRRIENVEKEVLLLSVKVQSVDERLKAHMKIDD